MKPLVLLITVFGLALAANKLISGSFEVAFSGRITLSTMLVFTAIGHFVFTKGMTMMIPDFIPFKTALVYVTGGLEIAAALALFVPAFRELTAWLLIVFFILMLPANIYAALHHVDYQQATYDGKGTDYLWFRVPLQLFFILWTYASAIKP